MRNNRPLPHYLHPLITQLQNTPSMIPPRRTRVPHVYEPVTHRYVPYSRVMTSTPPISLTVRESKVPRNQRGVVPTSISFGLINTTSLLTFVASCPIIPVVSTETTPSLQSCSPQGQMDCDTPTLGVPVQGQRQDDEVHSEHLNSKKDDNGCSSEAE